MVIVSLAEICLSWFFYFGWYVSYIGSDEGVYAWVAANYALGTLGM